MRSMILSVFADGASRAIRVNAGQDVDAWNGFLRSIGEPTPGMRFFNVGNAYGWGSAREFSGRKLRVPNLPPGAAFICMEDDDAAMFPAPGMNRSPSAWEFTTLRAVVQGDHGDWVPLVLLYREAYDERILPGWGDVLFRDDGADHRICRAALNNPARGWTDGRGDALVMASGVPPVRPGIGDHVGPALIEQCRAEYERRQRWS